MWPAVDEARVDMMNQRDIALVVTSCGRLDHLIATLESFARTNTYPISQAIIVEDGGIELQQNMISEILSLDRDAVIILKNEKNIGQIASIDRAYALVKAEFIFHCEDDWEFFREGYIEESLDILDSDKRIFCVWLRAHNDTNNHPIETKALQTTTGSHYYLMASNYRGVWSGFTLNPGLRRTADCLSLHPYASQKIQSKGGKRQRVTESDLSVIYGALGFRAAITGKKNGYVRHTGYGHHLASEWESRWWVATKNFVRRCLK